MHSQRCTMYLEENNCRKDRILFTRCEYDITELGKGIQVEHGSIVYNREQIGEGL